MRLVKKPWLVELNHKILSTQCQSVERDDKRFGAMPNDCDPTECGVILFVSCWCSGRELCPVEECYMWYLMSVWLVRISRPCWIIRTEDLTNIHLQKNFFVGYDIFKKF